MRCPICNKAVQAPAPAGPADPRHPNPPRTVSTFPFCSERCKLIDLGRWLDAKYQVPAVVEDDDAD